MLQLVLTILIYLITENHTTGKLLGVFGEETVNVVKVNIELGTAMGLLQN